VPRDADELIVNKDSGLHNASPTGSGSATVIADASIGTVGESAGGASSSPGVPPAPSGGVS
jgi:hypothetical protein